MFSAVKKPEFTSFLVQHAAFKRTFNGTSMIKTQSKVI